MSSRFDALRAITRRHFRIDYRSPFICLRGEAIYGSGSVSSSFLDILPTLQLDGPILTAELLASEFAVLAGTTVTNTGPTVINGDLGLSPGTSVTGFPPGIVTGTQHITDAAAAQAQLDLTADYLALEGLAGATTVAGNIGGQTLTPGLYKSTSFLEVSSGELTLDAQGDVNATFIFQIASTLIVTTGRQIILAGGAQAKSIFWQVGSSATLEVGSVFKGTIMALTSIAAQTGASVEGKLLARNGAVTLDTNAVNSSTGSGVLLNWSEVLGAFAYVVYRATNVEGPFTRLISGLVDRTYLDETVVSGNVYYYKITGLEPNAGETLPSNVVAVTVP